MTITMQITRTPTILELHQFLISTAPTTFAATNRGEAYVWVEGVLRTTDYLHRAKKEKGLLRRYLEKVTGYSRARVTELITEFRTTTHVRVRPQARHRFPRIYRPEDVVLLADTDLAHGVLSGPATREILRREHAVFGHAAFVRLSRISASHIANLRKTFRYREKTKRFQKTRPTQVPIGERRKPEPDGIPGFLRVDSVHQGDAFDGTKGVYHVNFVDEVIQWEIVVAVAQISERFLVPALEAALAQFPFVIRGFHADNGSEFINRQVAAMLERLLVRLTKSRPRHSNDNGLVETKNGTIIRKHLGYGHIPQKHAARINAWYREWFTVYLNFHRPCAFGEEVLVNPETGKRKRVYRPSAYQTPYERLKSLPNATSFLKPEVTFAGLDRTAYALSDTAFAKKMRDAKQTLFSSLHS